MVAQPPLDVGHRLRTANQLESGRLEERHGEIARQVHAVGGKADVHRKRLDQKFASVTVVERAGAEEQRHRRINRRFLASVPRDAQACVPKGQGLFLGHGELDRPQHAGRH